MNYDFAALSFTDFEALSRDLLGRELGIGSKSICQRFKWRRDSPKVNIYQWTKVFI